MPRPPEYCGQHGGDAELRGEVGDRAGRVGAGLALVPAVGGQVGVEVGLGGVEPLHEGLVVGQLAPAVTAHGAQQAHRVVLDGLPHLRVDGREDVLGRRVPGPPEVARQVRQRGQRRGQDGTDGESTDRTHLRTVAPFALDRSNFPAHSRWLSVRGAPVDEPRDHRTTVAGRVARLGPGGRALARCCRHTRTAACTATRRPARVGSMVGRIPILNVMPVVDLGRQAAKATVGEPMPVSATVFREGHDKLGAEVVATDPSGSAARSGPAAQAPRAARPLRGLRDARRRGLLDLRGAGVVRPDRHLAARRGPEDPRRRRRRADVHRGAAAVRAGPTDRDAAPRPTTRRSSRARSPRPRTPSARSRRAWRRCSPPS